MITFIFVYENQMKCLFCGKESGRCKLCRPCREAKQNASAMVSQNKKKLTLLLEKPKRLDKNYIAKFRIYCENIVKYGKILTDYKELDNRSLFSEMFSDEIKRK